MPAFKLTFNKLRGLDTEESKVVLTENIKDVTFEYDSPNDAGAKATNSNMTLVVQGNITDTNDEATLKLLNDWIKLEGQERGAYCEVTLDVIGANERYIRAYHFPHAFVVDYKESFGRDGEDAFELQIRQKRDMLRETVIDGGFIE